MPRLFAPLLAALALLTALPAFGFDRPFPANALRGKMTPANFPEVVIDGATRRMSPGARIFNQDNLIDTPASIRGSNIVVNYTVDGMGYIDRIWILTSDEAALKVPTAAEAAAAAAAAK